MVGSIQYLTCVSRPDLAFAAAQLACYMLRGITCDIITMGITYAHCGSTGMGSSICCTTSGYKLKMGACRDTDAAGEG
jgi:hypothetical protein